MNDDWKKTSLGDVLDQVERPAIPLAGTRYRQIGVKLWGGGAYERESVDGADTRYSRLFRARAGDIILNRIWARNGSVAVVPEALDGCFGSGEFPMFEARRDRLDPRWIHWITKTPWFWALCDEKSRGSSGKNRIRPERFLAIEIPLPPLAEQHRLVDRIEEIASRINQVQELRLNQDEDATVLLKVVFQRIIARAPRRPMSQVAPLVRRLVRLDPDALYPELGIRSFGKGTFHKPALSGLEIGAKRIFSIEPGDLLFSNVFAWEGAIAVARPEDVGRFGSHRFITRVPRPEIATPAFLLFFFLTDEGLDLVRAASPGGAGRNRTLGLSALDRIPVPLPLLAEQLWFDELQNRLAAARAWQNEVAANSASLVPSVLQRALNGAL